MVRTAKVTKPAASNQHANLANSFKKITRISPRNNIWHGLDLKILLTKMIQNISLAGYGEERIINVSYRGGLKHS